MILDTVINNINFEVYYRSNLRKILVKKGALMLEASVMDSFEWEVFKRTGRIGHYLMMKQREQENQTYLEEFGSEEVFNDEAELDE